MKKNSLVVSLLLFSWFSREESCAQTAERVPPEKISSGVYQYSGILWNNVSRGSATVVRHPRIAVSAAHIVYDDSAFSHGSSWLADNYFLAKHHSSQNPATTGQAKPLRGYWNFTTYRGTKSDLNFTDDFVVHYAYENLAGGGYAGWTESSSTGRNRLGSNDRKLLLGYASTQNFFMTQTGAFRTPFRSAVDQYFWNPDVGVVSGMSGGGAFIYNSSRGRYLLAGVIVSGNPNGGQAGTGLRAIDVPAGRLMARAIRAATAIQPSSVSVAGGNTPVAIPDNSSLWTVITLPVSGLPDLVEEVVVSLSITHPWIEDLEVVLRSPSRRTRVLHNRRGFDVKNLSLDHVIASNSFRGTAANGSWEVLVRDLAAEDTGTIDSVTLTVTGR